MRGFGTGAPLAARGAGAALLSLALTGCFFWGSDAEPPPVEPEMMASDYFELAEKELEGRRSMIFLHDVDHAKAISYFQEVIDNFPYSDLATEAELRIADTYFAQEKYEESKSYYQDFVELHPSHDRVPYAIYRNGLCSFERIRDADRDQGPTREAVVQFQALLQNYPNSEHADDAQRRLDQALGVLASRDLQVGDYYFEQAQYHAAIRRYQRALDSHPEHAGNDRTIARMGLALARLKRSSEAAAVLGQVQSRPLDEELAAQVEQALVSLAGSPRAPTRRAARSCWGDPNPACEPPPQAQVEAETEP